MIAKHWVCYKGTWYRAGEKIQVDAADIEEMKAHAVPDKDEVFVSEVFPPEKEEPKEEPKRRRGRPRKNP